MPKTDEEWVTSPAQVVSDNTPPRHRLRLYEEEFAMTDHPPTVSKEAREAFLATPNGDYDWASFAAGYRAAQLRTPAGEAEKARTALTQSPRSCCEAESKARAKYERETANDPHMHCNRFLTWEELPAEIREQKIAAIRRADHAG